MIDVVMKHVDDTGVASVWDVVEAYETRVVELRRCSRLLCRVGFSEAIKFSATFQCDVSIKWIEPYI